VASESALQSSYPDGGRLPDGFVPDGEPRWVRIAAGSSWAWFDHRMHPGEVEEEDLFSWVVPLRYGGQTIEVRGHWEERDLRGGYSARVLAGEQPFPLASVALAFRARFPGLSLRNDSDEPITVLGAAGEPFARVGPAGSEVNLHSPTWLATAQIQGYDVGSLRVDASAPPEWFTVGPDPNFFWLDARGLYTAEDPPVSGSPDGPIALLEWSVPLQRGTETATVRAVTDWTPAPAKPTPTTQTGTSRSGIMIAVAALTPLVLLAAVLVLLRRRRRPLTAADV
jgi:LPXTG-motif cell wall-anchored protein